MTIARHKYRAKPTEQQLQRQILDGLTADGWFAWRNNTGAFALRHKGKTRFVRFGVKGAPDILAIRRGVALAVEVKKPGNLTTDDQQAWGFKWEDHGGIYVVANSYADVLARVGR